MQYKIKKYPLLQKVFKKIKKIKDTPKKEEGYLWAIQLVEVTTPKWYDVTLTNQNSSPPWTAWNTCSVRNTDFGRHWSPSKVQPVCGLTTSNDDDDDSFFSTLSTSPGNPSSYASEPTSRQRLQHWPQSPSGNPSSWSGAHYLSYNHNSFAFVHFAVNTLYFQGGARRTNHVTRKNTPEKWRSHMGESSSVIWSPRDINTCTLQSPHKRSTVPSKGGGRQFYMKTTPTNYAPASGNPTR